MLSFLLDKYFKNFAKFIPYLMAKVFFDVILAREILINVGASDILKYIGSNGRINIPLNNFSFHSITGTMLVFALVSLFTSPIFAVFIRLIIRNILNNEDIDQLELLRETLEYYWRYIGLNIILLLIGLAVIIGIVIGGIIPVLRILLILGGIVLAVYIFTILSPITEYMVYKNSDVEAAFHEGMVIGKNYFWALLLLNICIGILQGLFKVDHVNGVLVTSLFTFITLSIEAFKIMYVMNLCKGDNEENQEVP